jgi:hypothetical protein
VADSTHSWPTDRGALVIGKFVAFISALEDGLLAKAARQQEAMRQLGFDIAVRPLGEPLNRQPPRGKRPGASLSLVGGDPPDG